MFALFRAIVPVTVIVNADRVDPIAVPITGDRSRVRIAKDNRRDIDRASERLLLRNEVEVATRDTHRHIVAIAIPVSGERDIPVQSEVET